MKEKIDQIKDRFRDCGSADAIYRRIIELGRTAPPLATKSDDQLVSGCQSRLYLQTQFTNNLLHFAAESDALISNGLAYLLTHVYSGESPETVLKEPPIYLEELGIPRLLSPTRSNGLNSLHLRMRQEALAVLTQPA